MPLFHDAHPNAEHPDRPDHEDFRLLAELMQDLDRQAEFGVPVEELVPADQNSVIYAADQRLLRALGPGWLTLTRAMKMTLLAVYLDAFTLGTSFANRRHADNETGTAGEGSSS
jgi:hypothetical protein